MSFIWMVFRQCLPGIICPVQVAGRGRCKSAFVLSNVLPSQISKQMDLQKKHVFHEIKCKGTHEQRTPRADISPQMYRRLNAFILSLFNLLHSLWFHFGNVPRAADYNGGPGTTRYFLI